MTEQQQAYRLLRIAAERMGELQADAQCRDHVAAGRSLKTFRYAPTPEQLEVCAAMPAILNGSMTIADGMALLHSYDVMKQRTS